MLAHGGRVGIVADAVARVSAALSIPAASGDIAQVSSWAGAPQAATAFGINTDSAASISRSDAMRVPAFARGRNTICGTVGLLSLQRVKGDLVDTELALLGQPDPATTRQHTLSWTVDDLLCRGIAWWRVLDTDTAGWPTRARWVPAERVTVRGEHAYIAGEADPVPVQEMLRFDAPHEGVLSYGAETLRAALALERAVKRYADNPEPTSLLFDKRPLEADVRELSEDDVDRLLERWRTRNSLSTTRWLNRMVGYERLSWTPNELDLTNARQQAAVQVARLLGMPSRSVNAPSESGMTYQNVAADRLETLDTACAPYLVAIEQRLSMDDVTPHGWRVRFDRDGYTHGTPAERIANAARFVDGRLGTADEARARYLDMPPLEEPTPPAEDTPNGQ